MERFISCNCTLPSINPDACKFCPIYLQNFGRNDDSIIYPSGGYVYPVDTKKKVTTIEKYDKDGNYLGKEVTSEEVFDDATNQYKYTYVMDANPSAVNGPNGIKTCTHS